MASQYADNLPSTQEILEHSNDVDKAELCFNYGYMKIRDISFKSLKHEHPLMTIGRVEMTRYKDSWEGKLVSLVDETINVPVKFFSSTTPDNFSCIQAYCRFLDIREEFVQELQVEMWHKLEKGLALQMQELICLT